MKILNLKYSLIFVFFLSLTACEEYLNRYPEDEISSKDYWRTTNDLKLYVNQFYPSAFYVSGSDRWNHIFAEDLESDDMVYVEANPRLRGSRIVPESGGWSYNNIRDVNYFFENYESCEDDFEQYKAYVGEAHFFRAFYYFDLVKEYGDVPYISKPLETNSDELYMTRTPRNQVIDSVVADLDRAVEFLPSGKQEGGTRLNKEIAQLFKSRVCLYEGTWEKYHADDVFAAENAGSQTLLELAVDAAASVIESGLYTIDASGDPDWNYFNQFARVDYSNNPGVMLWKKYDLDLGVGHARQFQTGTGSSGGVGLTRSFADSYLCTDGRPIYLSNGDPNPLYQGDDDLASTAVNRDPRFSQTIFTPGFPLQVRGSDTTFFVRPAVDKSAHEVNPTGYQMNKFLNFDPIHYASLSTAGVGFTGWIIFRYAEALLNYAEAKAELGTLTQADVNNTINLLRDRVGMPPLNIASIETDPNWLFPDLSPVINEIRRERRIELVGEGFRWDDIARWAAADELITGQRPYGAKFNSTNYSDLNPDDFKLTDGYFDPLKFQLPEGYGFELGRDYLSPISTEELNLNPSLEQNPGW